MPVTVAPSPAMFTELNLPVDSDVAPIGVPSIEPPSMSTVLDVTGDIGSVIHASLSSFLIFIRLLVVSNHINPAEIEVDGAEALV